MHCFCPRLLGCRSFLSLPLLACCYISLHTAATQPSLMPKYVIDSLNHEGIPGQLGLFHCHLRPCQIKLCHTDFAFPLPLLSLRALPSLAQHGTFPVWGQSSLDPSPSRLLGCLTDYRQPITIHLSPLQTCVLQD